MKSAGKSDGAFCEGTVSLPRLPRNSSSRVVTLTSTYLVRGGQGRCTSHITPDWRCLMHGSGTKQTDKEER